MALSATAEHHPAERRRSLVDGECPSDQVGRHQPEGQRPPNNPVQPRRWSWLVQDRAGHPGVIVQLFVARRQFPYHSGQGEDLVATQSVDQRPERRQLHCAAQAINHTPHAEGGESWTVGQTRSIHWSRQNPGGNTVDNDYRTDNGASWQRHGLIVKGKRISCPPHYAPPNNDYDPPHHDYEHGFPLIRSLRASAQRSISVLFSFVLFLLIVAGSFAIRQSKTILAHCQRRPTGSVIGD